MSDLPNYEVYAIRYATRASKRSDNFIGGDPHDGPMPLDYYVWAAIGPDRSYVIDTGFTAEIAAKRKRDYLRCPIESLKLVGLDPAKVADVILTHLHYDHVGNFDKLPAATFHLQESELHYAVGRYMRYKKLQHSYEVEDVVGMVRANYAGRVNFYDGVGRAFAGHHDPSGAGPFGGPAIRARAHQARMGRSGLRRHAFLREYGRLQAVCDGLPYRPACSKASTGLRAAAPSPQHIVPGHDPLVMKRYKAPRPELDGIVVRLDDPNAEGMPDVSRTPRGRA